jgi:hypothetical protein
MAKQGKTPIPIRLFDRLKLLAFTCRHAERTSRPHTYLTGIDDQMLDDLREQKEEEDKYFERRRLYRAAPRQDTRR